MTKTQTSNQMTDSATAADICRVRPSGSMSDVAQTEGINTTSINLAEPQCSTSNTCRQAEGSKVVGGYCGSTKKTKGVSLRSLAGHLETLELENFKSYGGGSTVVFGPFKRLNGVIGPNGAGKSNFMDGLSFVLGLHSKELRGSSMKDLIYRREGEEAEKMSGRSAVVRLQFREAATNDIVEFSRRISPSGRTSFEIDSTVVSSDEYNSKLATYNILVKAKNFLVFQGDVEEIAQKDPKELSKLFEHISGSGDLSAEYEETETSLKRVANGLRLHNIQKHHLDLLCKDLNRQVEEVQEFDALEDKIRTATAELFVFRLFVNESAAVEKRGEVQRCTDLLSDLQKQKNEVLEKLRATDSIKQKTIQLMTTSTDASTKVQQKFEEKKKSLATAEEKLKFTQEKIKRAEDIRATAELHYKKKRNHFDEVSDKIKQFEEEKTQIKTLITSSRASDPVARLTAKQTAAYETAKRESSHLTGIIAFKQHSVESQEQRLNSKINVLEADIEELKHMRAEETRKFEEAEERKELSFNELKLTREALTAAEDSLRVAEIAASSTEEDRIKLQREIDENEGKLTSFESVQRESFKEKRMHQIVSEMKNKISGVMGLLPDLCKPNNRRLNTAVASAFGKYNESVVVDKWTTAKACIDFLKLNRHQSMDFMPLDNLSMVSVDPRLRDLGGSSRPAADCLSYEIEFKRAFDLALKGAVIVDSLTEARHLAFTEAPRMKMSLKVITLEGEKILKNGNISFDSFTSQRGNQFDAQEVRQIERRIATLNQALSDIPSSLQLTNDVTRKRQMVQRFLSNAEQQTARQVHWAGRAETRHEEIELATKRIAAKDIELKSLRLEFTQVSEEVQNLMSQKLLLEKDYFSRLSAELGVEDLRGAEEDAKRNLKMLGEKEKSVEKKLSSLRADLKRLELELAKSNCSKLQKECKDNAKELKALQAEKSNLQEAVKQFEAEVCQAVEDQQKHSQSRQTIEEDVKKQKDVLRKAQATIDSQLSSISRLENELSALNSEALHLLRHCCTEGISMPLASGSMEIIRKVVNIDISEETQGSQAEGSAEMQSSQTTATGSGLNFEIDYEGFLPAKLREVTILSSADVKSAEVAQLQKIDTLKDRLQSKVPNRKAQDKYEETKTQLADIEAVIRESLSQKRKLEKMFRRLRHKRSELFMNCFETVRASIDRIYNHLTGGAGGVGMIDEDLGVDGLGEEDHYGLEYQEDVDTVGGQAFLELEEAHGDEPFSVGVQYHAMPPSKRFRDMQLLSGGEKTMAALALLFALQAFQQSPFFVLDEVDAALDSDNVASLANYLKTTNFQVVIISLKEKLYCEADCLFGVYKDLEKETSRLLSLDLTQFRSKGIIPTRTTPYGSRTHTPIRKASKSIPH